MATTIQVVLRRDKVNKRGEAALYLRFIKNRRSTSIYTGIRINEKFWDAKRSLVKPSHPNSARMNSKLRNLEVEYMDKLLTVETDNLSVSVKEIKEQMTGINKADFFQAANSIIEGYRDSGKVGSQAKAQTVVNKLKAYTGKETLLLIDINVDFLKRYEKYLQQKLGNRVNSIHKDMRFIRQVFIAAVKDGVIELAKNPFTKFKLRTEKTSRTFLHQNEIDKIQNCQIDDNLLRVHRDMFVFACYAGGLRVSDVLLLRWNNIVDGRLYLTIKKTDTQTGFNLPKKALQIIEAYKGKKVIPTDYVFGILQPGLDIKNPILLDRALTSAIARINQNLKDIAKLSGVDKHVTFHVSRHTFATNALKKGMRIEFVQKILGHANIRETQIYAKIENEDLDNAMKLFDME